jgi:hypothetical protein
MTSAKVLYHWSKQVAKIFQSLSKPESLVLAMFSFDWHGVVAAL